MNGTDVQYTFIIPHYNTPELLERCLNSIPCRPDLQIIIVDDNSVVSKKPVISSRPEVEYIFLNKKESRGAGRARNRGVERARGRWILFPDSDDYYNDGFLDILDKYKDSQFDIIYFNFEYRDGITLELLPDLPFKHSFDHYDQSLKAKDEIRFHHNVPWTKMVSREYLLKYNLNFEEVPNGNDILFSMTAGYFTENIMVEKVPIYVYLKNHNSISNPRRKDISFYMCKITHRIKQNNFYSYIGYPEWRISLFRIICHYIKQSGIKLFSEIIYSLPLLIKSRLEWIDIIQSKKS